MGQINRNNLMVAQGEVEMTSSMTSALPRNHHGQGRRM